MTLLTVCHNCGCNVNVDWHEGWTEELVYCDKCALTTNPIVLSRPFGFHGNNNGNSGSNTVNVLTAEDEALLELKRFCIEETKCLL